MSFKQSGVFKSLVELDLRGDLSLSGDMDNSKSFGLKTLPNHAAI